MAGMGSFDFSEFVQLSNNLKAMERAWPNFLKECIYELANRLLAKVVLRTPVDTGKLRERWTVGQVTFTSSGVEVEVFNPVLYASYVEHGHRGVFVPALGKTLHLNSRWTEGRFMLTISTQELEREIPAIMERRMKHFLESYLGK